MLVFRSIPFEFRALTSNKIDRLAIIGVNLTGSEPFVSNMFDS